MLDLHRYLMSDERRTLAFREAIHRVVKPGDVVVDLGSGSGILSLFAAQAGARKVFSIEKQHVADSEHLLVRQLGLSDRIQVFHQMSHEVELPDLADVLITETIGVVGFDEGILGNVADARKRMLRPGAAIIPRQLAMHVAPVTLPELHDRHIAWWRTPRFGFDLSPLAVFASNRLITTPELAPECFLGEPARILNADLTIAESESIHGQTSLQIDGAGILHGFGAWFTTELAEGISLSNEKPGTSWELGFFPLEEPVVVTPETTIILEIDSMSGTTWRWRGSIGERGSLIRRRCSGPLPVSGSRMYALRLATLADVDAIATLIPRSARALSTGFYTPEQTESAIRYVFGPDSQLIRDGTYYVAIAGETMAGCGGWSRRRTLYGGDQTRSGEDGLLDPLTEAARIRAFFIHPDWGRRGIGRAIVETCIDAAREAGFCEMELAATLPGEPLYRAAGFEVTSREVVTLPDGVLLPLAMMRRSIGG